MQVNRNHSPNVQFATLAHELGHLFLGHLGPDKVLNVPARQSMGHRHIELEAESVSFLVCSRNGVTSKAETYLAVLRRPEHGGRRNRPVSGSCGRPAEIETLLGLTAPTKYRMSESYPATGALPDLVVAADWSTVETKRWMVRGERVGDGYVVYPPEPVGDHKSLIRRGFEGPLPRRPTGC